MRTTFVKPAALHLAVLASACGPEAASQHRDGGAHAEKVVDVPVNVHGAIREIFMQGQTQSRVRLDELSLTTGTYGLGAMSELRGEITILEGKSWLAYSSGPNNVELQVTTTPSEDAALLVVADVAAWSSHPIDTEVSYGDLGAYVAGQASAAGWQNQGPLPFLIEGPVRALHWHVVDGSRVPEAQWSREAVLENAVHGTLDEGDVRLMGFYAPDYQLVFIPPGESIHVHIVSESPRASGHVEDGMVLPGAVLRLPVSAPR